MADVDNRRALRAEAGIPSGRARMRSFPTQIRAQLVTRDGRDFYEIDGYASTFEQGYRMHDALGEYTEVIDRRALDRSMANGPDVAFLVNHRGVTMARTTNGTLQLSTDTNGLKVWAMLNAERQDVRDFVSAVRDGLVDEMSFAFMLNDGAWNDDYTEFRITEADINRGDVSGVNYGANPYTSIQARSEEWLQLARKVPAHIARAGLQELSNRDDLESESAPETRSAPDPEPVPEPTSDKPVGRSLDLIEQQERDYEAA